MPLARSCGCGRFLLLTPAVLRNRDSSSASRARPPKKCAALSSAFAASSIPADTHKKWGRRTGPAASVAELKVIPQREAHRPAKLVAERMAIQAALRNSGKRLLHVVAALIGFIGQGSLFDPYSTRKQRSRQVIRVQPAVIRRDRVLVEEVQHVHL